MIGRKISHFRVVEKLGGGGMGVVYKAQDERLPRWVALKFLPPYLADSEEDRVRLEREASAASALDHPNICTIHEIDETEDGQLFIAMAFYEGETLKKKIEADTLSMDAATSIALQAAEGLAAAHHLGIIHRDIKPANLMITDDGTVKIVDFGLAKREGQTKITRTNAVLGTPIYMSPEQLRGDEVDRRSDVWSLGVVLFQMLSGELPFTTDYDQAAVYSILNTDPESISEHVDNVPDPLHRILATALARDPEERYQDAEDLALALRGLREELGFANSSTVVTRTWRPEPKPRSRPIYLWKRWALVAVLVLILGIASWLVLTQWSGPDPPIRSQEGQNLFDQARSYEGQGYTKAKLEAAGDLYRRALEIEPENPLIQAQLAALLAKMQRRYPQPGRSDQIEQLVEQSLAAEPGLAPAWIARGTLQFIGGDSQAAVASARRAVAIDPDDYRAHTLLGEALIAEEQIEKGLEELRNATELAAGFVWARESLGYSLLNLGRYDEAATEFEKVLDYDPHSPSALGNLAFIYQMQGRDSDALPLINQLLAVQPEDDIATGNLGIAYMNLDRMEEAIETFMRAHELAPNKPNHILNLADCYEKLGDLATAREWYEQAIAAYDKALEAGGSRPRLLAPKAVCFAKLGRFQEAIEAVEEAVELSGSATISLFLAAQVYALAGNDEKTYDFARRSLAAGHSRAWFTADLAFRDYQDDPEFRRILEEVVTP